MLAFAQPGKQHHLPVRELQRIAMHALLAPIDLPELRHFLSELKYELVINLKTAKTLGLDIPDRLLALTDEVIE
jgi:hypothetical protein